MLPAILIIAALVAALFILIITRPNTFTIHRSALINAPAAKVFEQVNDLHKWNAWSPWAKLDPNAKNTFAGPATGTGSSMEWDSKNGRVGAGKMTIIESTVPGFINIQLDFYRPFKNTNFSQFTFEPESGQTLTTWKMVGNNTFMGKAMGLIFNCDKLIGGAFEEGLANIKLIAEKE